MSKEEEEETRDASLTAVTSMCSLRMCYLRMCSLRMRSLRNALSESVLLECVLLQVQEMMRERDAVKISKTSLEAQNVFP